MHFNEVPGRHCPNKFFYPWKMPPFPTFLMALVRICPTIWEASPRLPPITDTLLHTAGVMWRPTMSSQASTTASTTNLACDNLVTTLWQYRLWQSRDNLRPLLRCDNLACHIRHRLVRRHTQPSPSGHAWNQALALAQVFLRFKTILDMFFISADMPDHFIISETKTLCLSPYVTKQKTKWFLSLQLFSPGTLYSTY